VIVTEIVTLIATSSEKVIVKIVYDVLVMLTATANCNKLTAVTYLTHTVDHQQHNINLNPSTEITDHHSYVT